MKIKLNFWNLILNSRGFSSVLLLIILPLITSLLYFVSSVVVVTAFKKEFKYICITESMALQRELLSILQNETPHRFNQRSKQGASLMAEKFNSIKSGVEIKKLNALYPKIEPNAPHLEVFTLAYELEYVFIRQYRLTCGTKLLKENNQWKFEVIY